jgi:hypothetical protein
MALNRLITALAILFLTGNASAALISYDGVTFPDGDISFADRVITFAPGSDVGAPHDNGDLALGPPDGAHLSIGDGGQVILQFTDNSLTTSGDDAEDLWIFEVGNVVEVFNVAISVDNENYVDLGSLSGQPTGIDIDAVSGVIPGTRYSFVRLTDAGGNQTGSPFGEADIDAVGAISSAPPVSVPEPGTLGLLAVGILGLVSSRQCRVKRPGQPANPRSMFQRACVE